MKIFTTIKICIALTLSTASPAFASRNDCDSSKSYIDRNCSKNGDCTDALKACNKELAIDSKKSCGSQILGVADPRGRKCTVEPSGRSGVCRVNANTLGKGSPFGTCYVKRTGKKAIVVGAVVCTADCVEPNINSELPCGGMICPSITCSLPKRLTLPSNMCDCPVCI